MLPSTPANLCCRPRVFNKLSCSCFQEVFFVPNLFVCDLFDSPMSMLENKKPASTPEVVSMMSKITDDKLNGPNYSDWNKTICLYLRSICMANHLDEDPPADDSKDR